MSENELLLQTHKNAESLFKNCEYQKAAKCYSKLVPHINSENIWHIEMLGNYAICLKKIDDLDLAEKILFQQIELYQKFYGDSHDISGIHARIGLCELYMQQKFYGKAISVLESHADSCKFSKHSIHYYLALNQEKIGQPFLAKKHAKIAIQAANNSSQKTSLENALKDLL